jgi:spermidine synthase
MLKADQIPKASSFRYAPLGFGIFLFLLIIASLGVGLLSSTQEEGYGRLIHETTSDYSQIRVREQGTVRSLLFVDHEGKERCQSSIDLAATHKLQLKYSKSLFASMLFHYPQKRTLVVGLGGGGMVQYLNQNFPDMMVEAVEIDPVVVALAAKYFGTVPGPKTLIHTQDAFDFFEENHGRYDAIYMDAFLRPPLDTLPDEKVKRLKTEAFLERLKFYLVPGGLVAFNLIEQEEGTVHDLAAIQKVFAGTYIFQVPKSGNLAVIATTSDPPPDQEQLRAGATHLERISPSDLDFSTFLRNLREWPRHQD